MATDHPNRSWRRRLATEAEALGPHAVAAWLMLHHSTSHVALAKRIRTETGCYADSNRLSAWQAGRRAVPEPVLALMRREILSALLGDAGEAVARILSAPAIAGATKSARSRSLSAASPADVLAAQPPTRQAF